MTDHAKQNQVTRSSVNAATETAGAITGAGIGLVIGGPVGALIGAGAGPLVAHASREIIVAHRYFWKRVGDALSKKNTDEDHLVHELQTDEAKREAFMSILRAAASRLEPTYLDFLANATAELSTSDSRKSAGISLLADIISSVGPLHLQMLTTVAQLRAAKPSDFGVTPDQLIENFDQPENLVRSLVRTLELHGLLVDNARLRGAGVWWDVTELGTSLLALYRKEPHQ